MPGSGRGKGAGEERGWHEVKRSKGRGRGEEEVKDGRDTGRRE